ncbi:hypothetical protein GCM10022247_56030 [Allokutzneria multivorans]|uniref:Uncharacterized protein n=1 Tax=Allokutzneria multivorans TaxID=1142134 RepID=A0ABP7TD90_9PSEU
MPANDPFGALNALNGPLGALGALNGSFGALKYLKGSFGALAGASVGGDVSVGETWWVGMCGRGRHNQCGIGYVWRNKCHIGYVSGGVTGW